MKKAYMKIVSNEWYVPALQVLPNVLDEFYEDFFILACMLLPKIH